MLSISKSLGLNRRKPIVIPTQKLAENPCPLPQPRAFLFQALHCQMVARTHYQKMLLAAKKRVFNTGIAIKPEEWRLPKAPVPSRPDFSRSLVRRPVRNVPLDSNVRDDTKEDGVNGGTDSVLLLVPNTYFISAFPTSEQGEPAKLYTSICNQKILHERQPQFIHSQKEESISEDENLTKANFDDYRQISSPEGTTEESLMTTDFERKESILMKRLKYSTGCILSTKFHKEAYGKADGTRLPFSHPYSYIRINSYPRAAERTNHWKRNMKNSVNMAKFLRIWNHAPEYNRPRENTFQSKNGQNNQMEVTGNTGTLFVKKTAKKEVRPKRKIKLKKQRPQLKIEMNKYFDRINEETSTISGLDDDGTSMLSEDLSQMEKSPSLPDLTRLSDKAKPKKQKLSKRKKHKRSKFQSKMCETAEAPITAEELLDLNESRDFLTKYCIIHPNRLSIYERVFQKSVSMQIPRLTRRTRLPSRQAPLALKEVSVGELVCGGEGHEAQTEEGDSESHICNGSLEEEEGDDDEEDSGDKEDEDEEEEEGDEDDREEGSLNGEDYDEDEGEDETEGDDYEENGEEENGDEEVRKRSSEETSGIEPGLLLKTTGQTSENVEMVQPNSAIEQHMDSCSGKAFLCQRKQSDIGLTMPERSLRKLYATSDILMDTWNDLVTKKSKLEDEKRQLVINKARELFPEGLDSKETQQEEVTLETVVMEACVIKIPEEITDEYILRHMTDSKMEQTKAELGETLNSIDTKIEILHDKMQFISKDMQVLEGVTENLQNYCYEYCTFGPQDTRPVSPGFRRQQSFTYNKLRPEKDLELNFSELEPTLQQVNKTLLTKNHCQYLYYILKISECCRINFRLFSVLAALSEKVTQLEPMVQNLIEKLDFDALDVKIKHSKELFNLLRTDDLLPGDLTTVTNLSFELAAGGIKPADAALVIKKLSRDAAGYVDFLDFVTYIPLFVEIHEKIIKNPLHSNTNTNLGCVSVDTS